MSTLTYKHVYISNFYRDDQDGASDTAEGDEDGDEVPTDKGDPLDDNTDGKPIDLTFGETNSGKQIQSISRRKEARVIV